MTDTSATTPTTVRLSKELLDRIDALALEQRRSRNNMIELLLEQALALSGTVPFGAAKAAASPGLTMPGEKTVEHVHQWSMATAGSSGILTQRCTVTGCGATQAVKK